jgi:FeS assembly SUF system protein
MFQQTESPHALAEPEFEVPRSELLAIGAGAAPGNDALISAIIAALRTVHDPEIPVNVYDLGLIYRIELTQPGCVEIDMTLTAPGCPVAGEMLNWVGDAVRGVAEIHHVTLKLVFDPPWDQTKMTEEAKLELGLF